ncbi:phage virion morphogenesis protein [Bacteroides neonati]|uniref:hypothetical protein n=1 Tax=Bacteroides neonati TaxID=1347393 RepID=UPI0004B9E2C3|nr:hypothetical protein [Bacteroides neonati]
MDNQLKDFNRICLNIERAVQRIPAKAAKKAVEFSKERFIKKNWVDRQEKPWVKTKKKGGSTLIKSGRLKGSIHDLHIGINYAIIGTDVPYARAHNDSGTFSGTETVRTHERSSHKRKAHKTRSGQRIKATTVRAHVVRSHKRKYKRTFIQRQFIGRSQYLVDQLTGMMTSEIEKAIQL